MRDYEIEDSTSTKPDYNWYYDAGMPSEEEGLNQALAATKKAFNPVESVKGVSQMLSGIANDAARAVGAEPEDRAPSFVGDTLDVIEYAVENPGSAITGLATAPGAIPAAMAGPVMVPKTGSLYSTFRKRPGAGEVRKRLDGVGQFESFFRDRPATMTNFPDNWWNRPSTKSYIDLLDDTEVAQELAEMKNYMTKGGDALGSYSPYYESVRIPRKPNVYENIDIARDSARNVRRHEFYHALDNSPSPSKRRKRDNYMEELNANIVGNKSVTKGLQDWGKHLSQGGYSKHGSKAVGKATEAVGNVLETVKPAPAVGPLMGASQQQDFRPHIYEVE